MRYLSVCAGIEAATVAWHHLGWTAAAYSEIDKFPRAVLKHQYPDVPLHGDFTTIGADDYGPIDLLAGGTPCQSFSVAGKRGGMADARGNLAFEYILLARRKRARWVVWENVPGVFSNNGGEDFRCFLSGLAGWQVPIPTGGWRNSGVISAGPVDGAYGLAWRVLDAQFAGVPQRRRRVFVVGYLGDWRRAAAVLFERHSLQWHSAPRREKGQSAPTIPSRRTAGGGFGTDFDCDGGLIPEVVGCMPHQSHGGVDTQTALSGYLLPVAHSLRAEGFDASEDGTGRGTPLVPVAIQERAICENRDAGPDGAGFRTDGQAYTLEARSVPQAVAFTQNTRDEVRQIGGDGQIVGALAAETGAKQQAYIAFSAKDHGGDALDDCAPTLRAGGFDGSHANGGVMPAVASASAVRRLTPRECERLQGFPDDYTLIPYRGKDAADGPRYKALGNSMAVPVMRWIGERIQAVEALRLNDASPNEEAA